MRPVNPPRLGIPWLILIGAFAIFVFTDGLFMAAANAGEHETIDEHQAITNYEGPQTCIACHEDEAQAMHGSVHYQQGGSNFSNATNIDPAVFAAAGERPAHAEGVPVATGINTYCGTHENSPRFTCAGCHVGNGRFPKSPGQFDALGPDDQAGELANIDCLMCHQEVYKRFPNGELGFEDLVLENVQLNADGNLVPAPCSGEPDPTCTVTRAGAQGIPIVSDAGDFLFEPADSDHPVIGATPLMGPRIEAARNVHPTTRKSCLNCHAGAGGANGTKRGDFDAAWAAPTKQQDVHMSPDGKGLTCADCHDAGGDDGVNDHRMRGRGLDLRPNDIPDDQFSCVTCHNEPHSGGALSRHTERVACQTCHIPTYAKGFDTEVNRDWEDPHLSDAACNGRGGWLPREDKDTNLMPTYAWYDGTSEVYYLGEKLDNVPMKDGAYVLGAPNGGIDSADAKIHPMKEHTGKVARHNVLNELIGHSTFEFFRTGSFDAAVRSGMDQTEGMNAGDTYTVEDVHTYQTLNHGVEKHDSALSCGQCHASLEGGPVRENMNLQALGFELKDTHEAVCGQCHNSVPSKGFKATHEKHVASERKDCIVCHEFSRDGGARGDLDDTIEPVDL